MLGNVHTSHDHAPGRGPEYAGDHPERGGFPGAVGTEKSEQLSLRYFEVYGIDRGEWAVSLGQRA